MARAASRHRPRDLRSADPTAADRPRPLAMSRCVICGAPIAGPSLIADDSGTALHPACLAERIPYDAAAVMIATAALFLIPFIRVWSA